MGKRGVLTAVGALLIIAAAVFSPERLANWFSSDGRLGDFVVPRVQVLRALALILPLFAAAWLRLCEETRRRLKDRAVELSGHPAVLAMTAVGGFLFILTEFRIYEWDPLSYGVCLYGSDRVARGEVPYRDFFSYLPPAFFYWTAFWFNVFGRTHETARLFVTVIPKFLCAAALYPAARALLSRGTALALFCLAVVFISPNPGASTLETQYMSLFLCLLTLPPVFRFLRSGDARRLPLAGAASAFAALFRQDFGVYVVAANLAALGLAAIGDEGRTEWRTAGSAALRYLAGWGAVLAATAASMLAVIPLESLIECFVTGPMAYMKVYSSHGKLAVPLLGLVEWARGEISAGRAVFILLTRDQASFIGLAAILLGGVWCWKRRRAGLFETEDRILAAFTAWTVFFMGYPLKGGSFAYIGVVPAASVILAKIARTLGESSRRGTFVGGLLLVLLAQYGGMLLLFRPFSPPPGSRVLEFPVGSLLCPSERCATDLRAAVEHVQRVVPEGERFLVYNHRLHDNYALLYFLAQRDSATRYHEMVGEVASSPEGQARIVSELERWKVRLIIDGTREAFQGQWPETDTFRRYVEENFEPDARFGRLRSLKRKTGPT